MNGLFLPLYSRPDRGARGIESDAEAKEDLGRRPVKSLAHSASHLQTELRLGRSSMRCILHIRSDWDAQEQFPIANS